MRKTIKVKIIEASLWDRLPQHVKDEINGIINYEPKEMVEVIHGKWEDGYKRQSCSVCRYRGMRSWNYCPHCGARMDGGR